MGRQASNTDSKLKLCPCGCGKEVPPSRFKPRIWYSSECQSRAWLKTETGKNYNRNKLKRLKKKELGRICKWCLRNDSEANWTSCLQECERCARQRRRSHCSLCGSPYYSEARGGIRGIGCLAGCTESVIVEAEGLKMNCKHGTCGGGFRDEGYCNHGHGTVLVSRKDIGEDWVQPMGRGCCPVCKDGLVNKIPFKPGENPNQ